MLGVEREVFGFESIIVDSELSWEKDDGEARLKWRREWRSKEDGKVGVKRA
jgi:hypothetical protein